MGGNSPSHFSTENGGGGITLVEGIRLSTRVVNRMKQPSPVVHPQVAQQEGSPPQSPTSQITPPTDHMTPPAASSIPLTSLQDTPPPSAMEPPSSPPSLLPETQTPIPSSASSPDPPAPLLAPTPTPLLPPPQETPNVALAQESAPLTPPITLIPPPPVKFHSLPPTSVELEATPTPPPPPPPPAETISPPLSDLLVPVSPPSPPLSVTTQDKTVVEPAQTPPPSLPVEPEVFPPPETPVPPLRYGGPLVGEQLIDPAVLSLPVESVNVVLSETTVAPPSAESVTPPATPSEPPSPAAEPPESIVPSLPPVEVLKPPPAVEPAPPEVEIASCPLDSAPVEPAILPLQLEPLLPPPSVAKDATPPLTPALHLPPSCELDPPPSPEPVAAPSPAPQLTFEELHQPNRCMDVAVVPVDVPIVDEPLPPPPSEPEVSAPISSPPPPLVEDEIPAAIPVPVPEKVMPVSAEVMEENLRQTIREEMQRSLEEVLDKRRQELQLQLEQIRALVQAEARAAAEAQVEEQVKKTLEAEKAAYMENMTGAIAKERMKTEDEKLMAQLYWLELKAHQLEEKERELKKRDVLYKEHVAKLESKCTEFYKVTAESFQKGKEDTEKRFTRFNVRPVCGDLQSQILKCYKENTGKTLSCSGIASAYMQCVTQAKKDKMVTGG